MKITRRTKLLIVALALCLTTMIGSTFAWFTDSAESAVNTIQAGNLDIEVQYTLDGENWSELKEDAKLFNENALWEPGHTEVVALKIENKGNLALKYKASMNIVEETIGKTKDGADIKLSDILTVGTLVQQTGVVGDIAVGLAFDGENKVAYDQTAAFSASNVLRGDKELQPNEGHYMFIKVDMAETVGNEANHNGTNVPSIKFGLNVVATQYPTEEDSFGTDYDAEATYPDLSEVELTAWEDVYSVNSDVTRENQLAEEYVEINHGSGNLTLKNVTFKNGLTIYTNNTNNAGTVTLENCTIYLNNGQGDPAYTTRTQHKADYGLNLNLVNGSDITFEFIDCTFTVADDHQYTNSKNSYNAYIGGGYSANSITFTGCTFEGSGKHGIGCSSEGTSQYYALTVTGCNFKDWNNNSTFTNGAAIRGNLPSSEFEANISISSNTFGNNNGNTQANVAIASWNGTWN